MPDYTAKAIDETEAAFGGVPGAPYEGKPVSELSG